METYVLPDGEITTVGARTLPVRGSVVTRRPMSFQTVRSVTVGAETRLLRGSVVPA